MLLSTALARSGARVSRIFYTGLAARSGLTPIDPGLISPSRSRRNNSRDPGVYPSETQHAGSLATGRNRAP